ncbi:FkbM family methyltransferase [Paraneptunicella aestuarii]|uniref:FkbM family methyltransferase n=1 Tax=Paraneptunicella aestuarii TaxID=2831148 RepID=UPI001E310CFD|nr:FkbM family methyltransferase [Paraneptunicella aestuarii]UAA39206.1 FkbM family methyltransferase [Paraneptunicella aestuarii]
MSFYSSNKEQFFVIYDAFYPYFINDKYVLIDGGAAGDLSQPFKVAEDIITGVRFEPRGDEHINTSPDDIYIEGGLWSEDGIQTLHVAKVPFASSICPPNMPLLEQFEDKYGVDARETLRKVEVPCRSIDSCVSKGEIPLPNFIKLDVHSAELPALEGAVNSLDNCVGLLVESWHSEIHLGQGLHHSIERFAVEHGFEVFDNTGLVRWRHKYNGEIEPSDRPQYIGSEMLFIKKDVPEELLLKKAFTLALFKFGNAAKTVLDTLGTSESKAIIDAITKQQLLNRA